MCITHTHTHTQPFYGSVEFVQDNPGEPVPEDNSSIHPMCITVPNFMKINQMVAEWYST